MNHQVISYKTKPEAAKKNADLIKDVFRELKPPRPRASATACSSPKTVRSTTSSRTKRRDPRRDPQTCGLPEVPNRSRPLRAAPPEFTDVKIVGSYGALAD